MKWNNCLIDLGGRFGLSTGHYASGFMLCWLGYILATMEISIRSKRVIESKTLNIFLVRAIFCNLKICKEELPVIADQNAAVN